MDKNYHKIKNRINILQLKKGTEKANKIINKIYYSNKNEEEKEIKKAQKSLKQRLTNIILEISDECCTNEEFKVNLFKTIDSIASQLKSYNNRLLLVDASMDQIPEFAYLLNSIEETKTLENENIQAFLSNIGLMETKEYSDQDYLIKWKLSPLIKNELDIDSLIVKLNKFKNTIVDNLSILFDKREDEKQEIIKKVLPRINDEYKKDKKRRKEEKRQRKEERKQRREERRQRKAERKQAKRERKTEEDIDHVSLDESLHLDNADKELMTMEEIKNNGKDIYDNLDKLIDVSSPIKISKRRLIKPKKDEDSEMDIIN